MLGEKESFNILTQQISGNVEAYLESHQISTMEFFDLTVSTEKSIIDFRLGFKYASVMEEDI